MTNKDCDLALRTAYAMVLVGTPFIGGGPFLAHQPLSVLLLLCCCPGNCYQQIIPRNVWFENGPILGQKPLQCGL